jgi:ornithine carbamoyltransferase
MYNLRNRSFLKESDFTARELEHLLKLSAALKTVKYAGTEVARLAGKEIALIFEKTSTRTRSAFEVAAYDQGAHVTYLDPSGSQLGHKESIADTARVLGRMYDAIEFRGSAQSDIEELAANAGVPVYNGLTDEWHPTQMLADLLPCMSRAIVRTTPSPTRTWATPAATWAAPCSSSARSWAPPSGSAARESSGRHPTSRPWRTSVPIGRARGSC